jgi:hypothetical protein
MPADKKDDPTGQDRQQQKKPAIVSAAADNGGGDRGDEKFSNREIHKEAGSVKFWVEVVVVIAALIAIPLGIRTWVESKIDNAVEAKMRSVLSDETILRKIAAQSRPSLIFNGNGSILFDMGAVQYLKPDDVRIVEHINDQGTIMPTKLHIGFVRTVSFAPLVTPLHDAATLTASHGKGLDWEFTINWNIGPLDDTNDSSRVYRLELVP